MLLPIVLVLTLAGPYPPYVLGAYKSEKECKTVRAAMTQDEDGTVFIHQYKTKPLFMRKGRIECRTEI